MDGHRNLDVWRLAGDLIRAVYRLTKQLPRDEVFVATAQMRRAAWSVQNNIAEGNARLERREMRRFMGTALASLAEVDLMRCTLPTLYELDAHLLDQIDPLRRKITAGIFKILRTARQ